MKQALAQRRVVISLFYANLLWWNVTYAQRPNGSFGPCTERSLGYIPHSFAVVPSGAAAAPEIAIVSSDPAALHFVRLGKDGTLVDTGWIALTKPQASVAFFETDRVGQASYVLVSLDGKEVSLVRRSQQKTPTQTFAASVRIQRILVADINNDRRMDLLLFGKSSVGVVTLLGTPAGTFKEGPLLFPEISVSDMKTMDINGDGITDVMLLNWLSNEAAVFYGITGTIFSEQVTVQLPGEPSDLGVAQVTRDRRIRAAVAIPELKRIVCLTGNATGEFELDGSIDTPPRPSGIVIADINGDGLPDVVSSTANGVYVALAQGPRSFASPAIYGNRGQETLWGVADVDGDRQPDLVLAGRSARTLVVAGNANHTGAISWPDRYIVGMRPHGICLGDFNKDGLLDIAVANTGSSTLSLLLNKGEGKFQGQSSLSVYENPGFVVGTPARAREGYTLFVSHTAQDMVTVVNLPADLSRPTFYAMPTGDNPYVLRASDDPRSRKLEILVRYRNERNGSISLSLFEQLSGKLFLERNLQAKVPHRITALTVADILGRNDLLVATNDRSSGLSTVSLASSAGTFDFKNVHSLFMFSDSTASCRSLVCAAPAASGKKNIFVVLSEPRNAIGVARETGEGTFQDSLVWIRDVRPKDDAAIDYQDVDGDGISDLTVLDSGKSEIVVYYGERDGRLGPANVVCPATDVTGFAIGAVRGNGRRDLVLTHGNNGTVSIIFHPFRQ